MPQTVSFIPCRSVWNITAVYHWPYAFSVCHVLYVVNHACQARIAAEKKRLEEEQAARVREELAALEAQLETERKREEERTARYGYFFS
jgi:hypothetical protein